MRRVRLARPLLDLNLNIVIRRTQLMTPLSPLKTPSAYIPEQINLKHCEHNRCRSSKHEQNLQDSVRVTPRRRGGDLRSDL